MNEPVRGTSGVAVTTPTDAHAPVATSATPLSIAIVVPVLNARRFLPQVIPSVLEAARRAGITEIVVVDNGSTDGSDTYVEATWPGVVRVVRSPGVRVGEVRNVGARATTADVLSFVDADCVLDPAYYDEARAVLADTAIDATGARYELPDDALWIERAWEGMHRRENEDGPVEYLNGGNFLVRRRAFDAAGGFDAALESGEDA